MSGCDANRPLRLSGRWCCARRAFSTSVKPFGRVADLVREHDADAVGFHLVAATRTCSRTDPRRPAPRAGSRAALRPATRRFVCSAPSWTALLFWIAFTVCFSVTWVISWPSTPASSASFFIRPSSPRVMCTMPPGAANALTPSVSSTMNFQFELRARARLREHACRPA